MVSSKLVLSCFSLYSLCRLRAGAGVGSAALTAIAATRRNMRLEGVETILRKSMSRTSLQVEREPCTRKS